MNNIEKLNCGAALGRYQRIELYNKTDYATYSVQGNEHHRVIYLLSWAKTDDNENALKRFANNHKNMNLYYVRNYATKEHNIVALFDGAVVRINHG